jgi:hypothetical protein
MSTNRAADLARITLAGIRIANGSVALFAPSVLAPGWGRAAPAPNCPARIPPVRDSNARVDQGHPTTTTTEAP